MSKSQVEIVKNAELLAANLQASPVVTKNALLSVVATFMSDPTGDLKRLRRTMTLLEKGSGGHLKRGGGFGDQIRLVIREVGRLLDRGEWKPLELKSLFGWTARLLLVRQEPRRGKELGGQRPERRDARPNRPSRDEKKPTPQPTPTFRAASGKNLDVLKALEKKLSDKDKKK